MKKKNLSNYIIILLLLIATLFLIRNLYVNNQLNKGTIQTTGIVTDINTGSGVRQVAGVDYYYYVKGKKYYGSDNGQFSFMDIGDTLIIEYAKGDCSVSKVFNKFFMKKYQYLKRE